jgi:hypothetical protein
MAECKPKWQETGNFIVATVEAASSFKGEK